MTYLQNPSFEPLFVFCSGGSVRVLVDKSLNDVDDDNYDRVIIATGASWELSMISDLDDDQRQWVELMMRVYGTIECVPSDEETVISVNGQSFASNREYFETPVERYEKAGLSQMLIKVQNKDNTGTLALCSYDNGKVYVFTALSNGVPCCVDNVEVLPTAWAGKSFRDVLSDSENTFNADGTTITFADFLDITSNYGLNIVEAPLGDLIGSGATSAEKLLLLSQCDITDLGL